MAVITHSFHAGPGLSAQLAELGWEVEELGTGLTASAGSGAMMRLGGALLTPQDKLPMVLRASPAGDGFDVTLEHDSSGFTDPLAKHRYKNAFDELEQQLAS